MAKRIYWATILKKYVGIPVGTAIGFLFVYLIAIGAISNVSYSGDVVCAGTIDDPCYAFINFTANEDIFIYPTNYDPWGRDTLFDFDQAVKSWKLERSWGKGWREIDLTTNCKGTWCGAPDNSGRNTYSIVFRDGRDYQLRITGYKNNPADTIKWGAFSGVDEIDPNWFGIDRDIGYEFLDDGKVVHIWNTQDDYFFNKSSGIQFTNYFQDYWTRNVFCLGYYSGETWNKIKCADELNNFNKNIQTDNLTYVNATLWKDISYGGYDLRLGVRYHLGVNDRNLSVTIYGKNMGIDIPFDLGFAWKVKDIEINENISDDRIYINGSKYFLNDTLDFLFSDMWENVTIGEFNYTNYYNYFRLEDGKEYVKVDWNKDLNYEVELYSNGTQSNSYVMLLVNAGTFLAGQEKSTTFHWADAEGDYITKWATHAENNDPYGIAIDGDFILVVEGSPRYWYKYWHNNGTYITRYSTDTPAANLGAAIDGDILFINRGASVDDAVAWWKDNGTSAPGLTISMNEDGAANAGDLTSYGGLLMTVDDTDELVYAWWISNKSLAWTWALTITANIQVGIETDGTFFWITNYASDDKVHKYEWDGTYVGESFDTTASGNTEGYMLGLGDEKFWIGDLTDDEIYVYEAIVVPSDTCNPSTPLSTNYVFTCSDNCTQSSDLDVGGFNITFSNDFGHFNVNANITNFNKIIKYPICEIRIYPSLGGSLQK